MNPTIKTFALIGLTLATAKDLAECKDERLAWRGKNLLKTARKVAAKYPGNTLRKNTIKNIEKSITTLYSYKSIGLKPKLIYMLSILLAGTDDILANTKNVLTKELFKELETKLFWTHQLIDPKVNQYKEYVKSDFIYQDWIKGGV